MVILSTDCDYFNDERDSDEAPDYCDECYRWEICAKDIISKLTPIPLEALREYIKKEVWVQTPGIYKYGREGVIEDVNEEKKIMWLVDDFTCHDYGRVWLAYPMDNGRIISYKRKEIPEAWKQTSKSCHWEYSVKP